MIVRVMHNKENPYVIMNKKGLEDENLSFKAKGLLAYLLAKPDNWEIRITHLAKVSKDGIDAVRSGINELIKFGYAERIRVTGDDGRVIRWEINIFEVPQIPPQKIKKQKSKKAHKKPIFNPDVENPDVENPDVENPTLLINDIPLNNDFTKYTHKNNQKNVCVNVTTKKCNDLIKKYPKLFKGFSEESIRLIQAKTKASIEEILKAFNCVIEMDKQQKGKIKNPFGFILSSFVEGKCAIQVQGGSQTSIRKQKNDFPKLQKQLTQIEHKIKANGKIYQHETDFLEKVKACNYPAIISRANKLLYLLQNRKM